MMAVAGQSPPPPTHYSLTPSSCPYIIGVNEAIMAGETFALTSNQIEERRNR